MPNLEWDVPQFIASSDYEIDPNVLGSPRLLPSGRVPYYLVMIDNYQIVPAKLRTVADSISQADGSSIQSPYIDGLVATLELAFMVCPAGAVDTSAAAPACAEDLRVMNEWLMALLNQLRDVPIDPLVQSYFWAPTGASGPRGLNGVILHAWPAPDFKNSPEVRVKFELASPYPYAVGTGYFTTIADGANATIPNDGNCNNFPVARAHGPSTAFAITNFVTGRLVSYDSTRPGAAAIGAGHYAEIDFFAGTIYRDGDPNIDLIAGLDPAATDLFPIPPGGQRVDVAGATVDMLSQDSWV